jgi:hypothetical protein
MTHGKLSEQRKPSARRERRRSLKGGHTVLPLYAGIMIRRSRERIFRDGSGAY